MNLYTVLEAVSTINQQTMLYGCAGFVLLALFWYFTGRFFLIGWLVKLIWLLTVTPFCLLFWFCAVLINGIFDNIRNAFLLSWLLRGGLIGLNLYLYDLASSQEDKLFVLVLFVLSLVFLYLIQEGLPEQRIKSWIFATPKARKQPLKLPKVQKMKPEKRAEDLTRPVVKILISNQGNSASEGEITSKLSPHLQALIGDL